MSKQDLETFVHLTRKRKEIVKMAIEQTKSTDVSVVAKQIKKISLSMKKSKAKRMGIDTDENISNLVESYVAYFEEELLKEGYMEHPIGGMLRERIKINNQKKIKC